MREHEKKRHRLQMQLIEVDDACEMPPTFTLRADEAQALVDELHRNGFRPTEQIQEQSALPYITAHLNDMRRLVFENDERRRPDGEGGLKQSRHSKNA